MFRVMLLKMWHKKWMNLCLFLGCILLVATVVSFPLYQNAAYDRMLHEEFTNSFSETGVWPGLISMTVTSKKDKEGKTIRRMEELMGTIYNTLGVDEKESVFYYYLWRAEVLSTMNRSDMGDISVSIGTMANLDKHAKMLSGEMYSETGINEDGAIEVVISSSCMVDQGFLVGETIYFKDVKAFDGSTIKMYIKGVFDEEDYSDVYWQHTPDEMGTVLLMNNDLFKSMFTGENAGKYNLVCYYDAMFEYAGMSAKDAEYLSKQTDYLAHESAYKSVIADPDYINVLDSFTRKKDRISQTLVILQIPVLVMLAAFLLMISGQMYEMERNEISVIKSRGSSGAQIFRIYLYQGLSLTVAGAAIGIPLGRFFAGILGATRNFLEFDSKEKLPISYTTESMIYAGAAMFVTLMCMTLPAIKHSRVTIVKLKQAKALKKKSWWEKFFLDIVLLAASIYGFYNFHRNIESLKKTVLEGKSLDPLLYISSSLFILGAGLLFLRLQPYIVKLIYNVGKKFWGPASHVSFMENIKNGRKQQLIMLFLIMTISLGMFHANVARTILSNAIENTNYKDGTDLIIKEAWVEMIDENGNPTGEYAEPEESKYADAAILDSYTKVYYDEKGFFTPKSSRVYIDILGIHTKKFGQITSVDKKLNGTNYYELLNKLAVVENGVLLSENFKNVYGLKEGDNINFSNYLGRSVNGKVVGFFSYFPGYAPTVTSLNPDGTATTEDKYLLVTHYDITKKKFGLLPYEVWGKLSEGTTEADVISWVNDNKVKLKKYVNRPADIEATMKDPLLSGTNGVLTLGFVVTILLCGVGYLIYWVMSIRERELVFGVLRACGFHKGEVIHMLLNEQIFSGIFSIFAGIGIGKLTSTMFVPILEQAYASTDQILPMEIITNKADMLRLYGVIGLVMVICFVTLSVILFRMNVTKALKLGEE